MNNSSQIVCPHCWAINRVPKNRLGDSPRCGKCKQLLFDSHIVELSMANLARFIAQNDIPVMIDFWAIWSSPCEEMSPAFKEATNTLEPHIRMAKVNIEAEPSIADKFQIQNLPMLAIFHQGKEIARKNGVMDMSGIINWANTNCSFA